MGYLPRTSGDEGVWRDGGHTDQGIGWAWGDRSGDGDIDASGVGGMARIASASTGESSADVWCFAGPMARP